MTLCHCVRLCESRTYNLIPRLHINCSYVMVIPLFRESRTRKISTSWHVPVFRKHYYFFIKGASSWLLNSSILVCTQKRPCAFVREPVWEGRTFPSILLRRQSQKPFHGKPIILSFQLCFREFSFHDLLPQLKERGSEEFTVVCLWNPEIQ